MSDAEQSEARLYKVYRPPESSPLEGVTPAQEALSNPINEPVSDAVQVLEERFHRLFEIIEQNMEIGLAAKYGTLLTQNANDQILEDGVTYLGMVRAPAARGNHHAFEGGLVFHLLEMWDQWQRWRDGLRIPLVDEGPTLELINPPYITDENVLCAILNHDIHKAWACYVQESTPDGSWKVNYGKHWSNLAMNNTLKSIYVLQIAGIPLDIDMMNALALAEGGWTDQKNIRETTVLAKIVYLLDDMSANVISRVGTRKFFVKDRAEP